MYHLMFNQKSLTRAAPALLSALHIYGAVLNKTNYLWMEYVRTYYVFLVDLETSFELAYNWWCFRSHHSVKT